MHYISRIILHTSLLIGIPLVITSCGDRTEGEEIWIDELEERSDAAEPEGFDRWIEADIPVADGFDFPIGDRNGEGSYVDRATGIRHNGWYIATEFAEEYDLGIHPGEDWNGKGGGATDLGQPVRAVAAGRVVVAKNFGRLWGNVIVIEHLFYENHHRRHVHSLYAHLASIDVAVGEDVTRRQGIGTIGQDPDRLYSPHLHLEIRNDLSLSPTYWPSSHGHDGEWVRQHYREPSRFIREHRTLFVPQNEPALLLIDQATYRMKLYRKGAEAGEYDVSFGQGNGRKREEGDNRTPMGMYFIVEREQGDIPGRYGAYFGRHWLKINYPNRYDAEWGVANGKLDQSTAATISRSWAERKPTPQSTNLGGGIGLHGWIEEWENDGPRHLSWGCVVLHNRDITQLYRELKVGTMVVIL